jgi:hypothetical protein
MSATPCKAPGPLWVPRGGVFVKTDTARQRIASGWYSREMRAAVYL